jgi:hypothetical protein
LAKKSRITEIANISEIAKIIALVFIDEPYYVQLSKP